MSSRVALLLVFFLIGLSGYASKVKSHTGNACTLSGKVIHRVTGEPVAGVTVAVGRFEHVLNGGAEEEQWVRPYTTPEEHFEVQSDSEGNFEITSIEPGERLLLIRDDTFAAVEGELLFELDPAERQENIELYVVEGASISGTVYNVGYYDGVEGVEVEAEVASNRPWRRTYQSTTAGDGTFHLGGLPMGMCTIRSSMEDGFTQESLVFHGETPLYSMTDREALPLRWNTHYEPIEFTVKEGSLIQGQVVDKEGTPVEGAEVFVIANRSFRKDFHAYTREDGSFLLMNWEYPKMPRLIAYKDGKYSPSPIPSESVSTAAPVQLRLLPSATLTGQFVDKKGAPLKGANQPEVNIEIKGRGKEGGSTFRRAVPDSNGRFQFDDLPPVTYDFQVWGGPFDLNVYDFAELSLYPGENVSVEFVVDTEVAALQKNKRHDPNRPPPLTMKRITPDGPTENEAPPSGRVATKQSEVGGILRGLVLNRESRVPVRDYEVTIYKWYGEHRVKLRSSSIEQDSRGGFEASALPFESLVVEVRAEGYNLVEESVILSPQMKADTITFRLDAFTGIRGELVDTNGFPVSNARIYYSVGPTDERPDTRSMAAQRQPPRKFVEADAMGVFYLESKNGDIINLEVDSLYPPHREQVTAGPGAQTRKRFVITDGGAVFGSVTKGGQPLENATIGTFESATKTDADGFYRLEGVRLGNNSLTCSFSESVDTIFDRERSLDFIMQPGEMQEINIDFLPGEATLAGRITDIDRPEHRHVLVEMPFLKEEKIGAFISAREDGTFLIPHLPQGMVWVTTHEDRRRRGAVATARAGETSDVTISMAQGVAVSGNVERNGVAGPLALYAIPGAADWRTLGSISHHKLVFLSVDGSRVEEDDFSFDDVSTGTVSIVCTIASEPDRSGTDPAPILGSTLVEVGPDGLEGVIVQLGAPQTGK